MFIQLYCVLSFNLLVKFYLFVTIAIYVKLHEIIHVIEYRIDLNFHSNNEIYEYYE